MIGIYCITNKVNNKKYFGQSTNIEKRKKAYFSYRRFPNDHLKNAFNKYGKENFEFEIIKCCKEKYLDRFEKLYIRINDTMNPDKGYNKDSGGHLNKHHSNETRRKISKNNGRYWKGKTHSEKSKKKMSKNNARYWEGKNHSEETKKKVSENNARYWEGKTFSEEHKKKMSESSAKYNIWNINFVDYDKRAMFKNNGGNKPKKAFRLKYNKKGINIGGFIDFITPEIIGNIIAKEVN